MIKESKKNRLPADLYSRNTLFSLLVSYILSERSGGDVRNETAPLEILDVGGYASKFAWFMPQNTRYTVLDLKPAPEIGKTNYVCADARAIPFPDASFDLVLSSDMLEHVPKDDRHQVISEIFRVSRRHVIIAAPFAGIMNQKAEEFINDQFRKYTGSDHPFLIEHINNGLPELEEIENYVRLCQYSHLKIGEGNIYNWYLQQLTSMASLSRFNEFFNENLSRLGNFRAPTYRTVLFCDKQEEVDRRSVLELVEDQNNFHTTTYLEAYKIAFEDLKNQMDLKDEQFSSKQAEINASVRRVAELEQKLEKGNRELTEKNSQIKLLGSQIDEIQGIVNDKDAQLGMLGEEMRGYQVKLVELEQRAIARISEMEREMAIQRERFQHRLELLDTQIRTQDLLLTRLKMELEQSQRDGRELTNMILLKEQHVAEKNEEIAKKNQQILGLQSSLAEYKHELETVLASRSWKLVRLYGAVKNAVYTRPKYLLRTSVQVIRKMGVKEFLIRARRKIMKRLTRQGAEVVVGGDYQVYVENNMLGADGVRRLRQEIAGFEYRPMISLVVPVYNVDERWLRRSLNSVLAQVYDKWELCLADDASTNVRVREILREYSALDPRIRVSYRSQNGGIVRASNTALKMARGAYIGLMDNDDELTPDALYEVVKALQKERYELLYSDEDKLELDGTRTEPHFKPDFNQDLLFSNNYICHFTVIRRKLVEEIGGFREGTDGSQDYDLILRLTERKRRVHHIPKVLYSWRKIPGSTAATIDAKPYVFESAKKALRDTLKKRGIKAEVHDGIWKGSYRVQREIVGEPLVSIIIPFRDRVDVLRVCLDSIFAKTTYQNYEILLVNNSSELLETREYMREIEHCPRVRLLHYNAPYNFSAINNFASIKAQGEYLLLLNNDTEVIEPDWIQAMLEHAQRPDVGCVGAKLLFPQGNQIQHCGVIVGVGGAANHAFSKHPADQNGYFGNINVVRNYSAVTGACMMVKKSVFEDHDGLDEENLAVAFNDVDFCLRLREKGLLVVYTPYATLYHYESLSRGYSVNFNEEYFLRTRHHDFFQQRDPSYNPNLTIERLDFSLRVSDSDQKK